MEATEGDERHKHQQSKRDFGKPRFDTFYWQKLCPITRFLGGFNKGPIQCVR